MVVLDSMRGNRYNKYQFHKGALYFTVFRSIQNNLLSSLLNDYTLNKIFETLFYYVLLH